MVRYTITASSVRACGLQVSCIEIVHFKHVRKAQPLYTFGCTAGYIAYPVNEPRAC